MSEIGRRHRWVVSVVVIGSFALLWFTEFVAGEPLEGGVLAPAIMLGVVAILWVLAVQMMWRAWWESTTHGKPDIDEPAWLLSVAIGALADDRQEWGEAMTAELEQVQERSARWWFALGGAKTAMFPPLSNRGSLPAAGLVSLVVIGALGVVIGNVLPSLQLFTVVFATLIAIGIMLGTGRSRHRTRTSPIMASSAILAVIGCVAITVYFLIEHPSAGEQLSAKGQVTLALVLGACLWLAFATPRVLIPDRASRSISVVTGGVLGLGYLVTARYYITDDVAGVWVIFGPMTVLFLASLIAAAKGRSFGAGLQTALWSALLGSMAIFLVGVPEALRKYGIDSTLLFDGESGYQIGVNLADAIWILVAVPILGAPFGVFGAYLGNLWARRRVDSVRLIGAAVDNL